MSRAPLRARWEQAFRRAGIARGKYGISTVAVGLTFATWANLDGTNVFPSQEKVAKGLGVGPRTVSRAVARLVAEEWLTVALERKPPYRMVSRYRLSIPPGWVEAPPEAVSPTDGASARDEEAPSTSQQSPLTNTETKTGTITGVTNTEEHDSITTTADHPSSQAKVKINPWLIIELEEKYRTGEPITEAERYLLECESPLIFAPSFDD